MIKINNVLIEQSVFSNNESHFDISNIKNIGKETSILFKYEDDRDIFCLIGAVEHIRDINPDSYIKLHFQYLPYSRMDRGNNIKIFTLRSLARILNNLDLDYISANEIHSEKSLELINNLEDLEMTKELTKEYIKKNNLDEFVLVYPDAGAGKRYSSQFELPNTIQMNKKRDFKTGKLTEMVIETPKEEFKNCKTAIIVDDLCSKGGTFGWAADILEKEGIKDIVLIVTHLEKTILEGRLLNNKSIKKIIATDSMLKKDEVDKIEEVFGDKIKIVKL